MRVYEVQNNKVTGIFDGVGSIPDSFIKADAHYVFDTTVEYSVGDDFAQAAEPAEDEA